MKENIDDILKRANRSDGTTVPEGYFADFASAMASKLPEKQPEQAPAKRTLWMQVRPYVYMAAMFAGVWCMLKVFTLMSAPIDSNVFDTNPILAEAVSDDAFINEYVIDDINQWDVIDEMISDGFDADDFDIAFDADSLMTFEH